MGETGVRHVMKSLLADFDIFMNAAGFQNVGQIDKTVIGMYTYPVLWALVCAAMMLIRLCRILSEGLCDDCGEIEVVECSLDGYRSYNNNLKQWR